MGIRLPSMIVSAKQILKLHARNHPDVPERPHSSLCWKAPAKAICRSHIIPEPPFICSLAEEEFGFNHPMGGLTIPFKEDAFINVTSKLNAL